MHRRGRKHFHRRLAELADICADIKDDYRVEMEFLQVEQRVYIAWEMRRSIGAYAATGEELFCQAKRTHNGWPRETRARKGRR